MTLTVGIIITAGVLILTAMYIKAGIQVRNEQRGKGSIDYSKDHRI